MSLFDQKVKALTDQGVPKEVAVRFVVEEIGKPLGPPQTWDQVKGKIAKALEKGPLVISDEEF